MATRGQGQMFRGLVGGVVVGGLVSAVGLGTASLLAPLPDGLAPTSASMTDVTAPGVTADPDATVAARETPDANDPENNTPDASDDGADMAQPVVATEGETPSDGDEPASDMADMMGSETNDQLADVSSPVGSLEIEAPQAPQVPENDLILGVETSEVEAPEDVVADIPDVSTPNADTDPLDEPVVASIEGSMSAPEVPQSVDLQAQPVEPVFPNPQSLPPETPESESDLMVSTSSASPTPIADQDEGGAIIIVEDGDTDQDIAAQDGDGTQDIAVQDGTGQDNAADLAPQEDSFVVDLTAPIVPPETPADATEDEAPEDEATEGAAAEDEATQDEATASTDGAETSDQADTGDVVASVQPRVQLQGTQNALLDDARDTGVTVNRLLPANDPDESTSAEEVAPPTDALGMFAADAGDIDGKALMSIVLIDDGSMSAASAALAGLPFPVTIALDPAMANATDLMTSYREAGFEVAVMAMLPEGALPTDVEVTFESVFRNLPETVAVLDIGTGGLQSNRDVTEQAMSILAEQGRGYVTVAQGLNTAGRAAQAAGVPSVEVFRDLDSEGQDARVIRRFVDNAAFRARQESGVVLVGRVRPDTISALILWGATAQDELTAVVPVSAVLLGQ